MSRSDEQRVQDILDASDQVLEVVRDGRDAWDKDRFRQLAVESLLGLSGIRELLDFRSFAGCRMSAVTFRFWGRRRG